MSNPISISPQYTSADWTALRFLSEDDWDKGVRMLEDRIEGRFLEVIRRMEGYTYAGFAVLALDCLLIETLEQFYRGEPKTPTGQGKNYFRKFLTRTTFGKHFDVPMADEFYESVRCGILHQAEVKNHSLVLRKSDKPLVRKSAHGAGLEINRVKFHKELVAAFGQYAADLRNPANIDLRANFRKKMDHICTAGAIC